MALITIAEFHRRRMSIVVLFREGEAGGTLYGVLRGSLRFTKRAEFDVEEAEVFKVSREDFNSLAEKEPRLGCVVTSGLAEQLARFLRSMDER